MSPRPGCITRAEPQNIGPEPGVSSGRPKIINSRITHLDGRRQRRFDTAAGGAVAAFAPAPPGRSPASARQLARRALTPVHRHEVLVLQHSLQLLCGDLLDLRLLLFLGGGGGGGFACGRGAEREECHESLQPPSHGEGARGLNRAWSPPCASAHTRATRCACAAARPASVSGTTFVYIATIYRTVESKYLRCRES